MSASITAPQSTTIAVLAEQLAALRKAGAAADDLSVSKSASDEARAAARKDADRFYEAEMALILAIMETPPATLSDAFVLVTLVEGEIASMETTTFVSESDELERLHLISKALMAARSEIGRHAGVSVDGLGLVGAIAEQPSRAAA